MNLYRLYGERTNIDIFGIGGTVLGVLATLYMLFYWQMISHSGGTSGTATAGGGIQEQTTGTTETVYEGIVSVLTSSASSDVALLVWPVVITAVAVIGGIAAWKRHRAGIWASAIVLSAIAIVGIFSFGLFVIPSAIAMLIAAVLVQSGDGGDTASRSPTINTISTYLLRYDVLVLFLFLAGPITLLQIFDINQIVVSLIALPGYFSVLLLSAVFTELGISDLVGTSLFYAVHVVWAYLFSMLFVLGVRSVSSRL